MPANGLQHLFAGGEAVETLQFVDGVTGGVDVFFLKEGLELPESLLLYLAVHLAQAGLDFALGLGCGDIFQPFVLDLLVS